MNERRATLPLIARAHQDVVKSYRALSQRATEIKRRGRVRVRGLRHSGRECTLESCSDRTRKGEERVKRLQTKVTVRRTKTTMRSAWDFGRVRLFLTSASFAFFNTGSFLSFSSLSLCPPFIPSFPEMAGFPPPDPSAQPDLSLVEQFRGVLCLQIKLHRDFAHPHGENFSTFDLRPTRDRSRKHRRDTRKFSYRISAIHIDPYFSPFLLLARHLLCT